MSNNQAQNSKTAKTLSFGFWHLSLLCFLLFEFGALSLENILIFHFVNGLGVKLTGEKEAKFEGMKREEWGILKPPFLLFKKNRKKLLTKFLFEPIF